MFTVGLHQCSCCSMKTVATNSQGCKMRDKKWCEVPMDERAWMDQCVRRGPRGKCPEMRKEELALPSMVWVGVEDVSFFLILFSDPLALVFFFPSLHPCSHSLLPLTCSSLSHSSSQASLALIDPLVRAYGTAMNCIVTSCPEQEQAGMDNGRKCITTRA